MFLTKLAVTAAVAISVSATPMPGTPDNSNAPAAENEAAAPAEPAFEMKKVCTYGDSGSRLGGKVCTMKKVPRQIKADKPSKG